MDTASSSSTALAVEIETFNRERDRLVAEARGQYVLIRGKQVIGIYPTEDQALIDATRLFGLTPYLVRPIQETEPEVRVPALTLGLLNADSQRSND